MAWSVTAAAQDVVLELPPLPDLGRPAFERAGDLATRCDVLAAVDYDLGRADRGVNAADIGEAAVKACVAAAASETDPRYRFQLARALRTKGDHAGARAELTKAADLGHAGAMVALSWMLQSDVGGPPDLIGAVRWAERAAAQGDGDGLYRLAGFYRHALTGRVDLAHWIALLEQAAAAGSVDALRDLGVAYEQGIGVKQNADVAADLFLSVVEHETARADRGVASAMTTLGFAAEFGLGGVARDPAAAAQWYRKADAGGDPRGSFGLGRLFVDGRGVGRDASKGCDQFERSAREGNVAALTNVAICFETGDGRSKDLAQATRLFERAMAAGDDRAPLHLGRLTDAQGPNEKGRARELLRMAAERGNADGMLDYAFHLRSEGAARARDACDWYERGASLGHARAMNNFGVCFADDGGGRDQDYATAFAWYQRAAARGDGLAFRNLGDAHLNGIGVAVDKSLARDFFRRGAEADDPGSMVEYGMLLTQGIAGAADTKTGCDWFERAGQRGSSRGMNNIGACFANGEGRPVNVAAGLVWYEKAIAAGDMVAMANLGELYMTGRGVTRDLKRAIELYRRSADLGHAPAAVELAAALYNGSGLTRDAAAACGWYERAAQSNNPAGLNGLGVCTENGVGRRRDAKLAMGLFVKAAQAGSLTAYRNLVRINDRGIGIGRNPDVAADWLRQAIEQGYDSLLNDFLSYPSSWSRETRRALQKALKRDGRYDGPIDGYLSTDLDRALWTIAAQGAGDATGTGDTGKSERLVQAFTFAPIEGAPKGLLVRVCKAANATGRQPLVIINHGLTTDDAERRDMRPLSCGVIASFFARRGYTVAIPLRRGYGETAGRFGEGGTRVCATSPNFTEPGLAIASDIEATIAHLTARGDGTADGTIVLGHSGGGWGALALASKNGTGFAGFVNISGVHGSNRNRPDGVCGPEPIVRSTREFGRKARAPTLWIYAENDSHAGPRLVRRMFDGFTREGGNGVLHVLPPHESDGHNIFDDDSFDLWGTIVDDWLTSLKQR